MKKLTFNKVMNNMIALEAVIDDTLFARKDEEGHMGRNLAIGAGGLGLTAGGLGYAGRNTAEAQTRALQGIDVGGRLGGRLGERGGRYGAATGMRVGQGVGAIEGGAKRAYGASKGGIQRGYGYAASKAKALKDLIAARFKK